MQMSPVVEIRPHRFDGFQCLGCGLRFADWLADGEPCEGADPVTVLGTCAACLRPVVVTSVGVSCACPPR